MNGWKGKDGWVNRGIGFIQGKMSKGGRMDGGISRKVEMHG